MSSILNDYIKVKNPFTAALILLVISGGIALGTALVAVGTTKALFTTKPPPFFLLVVVTTVVYFFLFEGIDILRRIRRRKK